jgi:hypothetical protein
LVTIQVLIYKDKGRSNSISPTDILTSSQSWQNLPVCLKADHSPAGLKTPSFSRTEAHRNR